MEITLIIVLNLDDKYIEIIKRRVGIMSIAKFIVNIIAYVIATSVIIGGVIGLIFTILAIGTHPLRLKLAKLIEYLRRAI